MRLAYREPRFVGARFAAAMIFAALAANSIALRAVACDLCAIYTATEQRESRTGFRLGVSEQYTFYGTLQDSGQSVANPAGERMNSFITQFVAGYTINPQFGVQINLPLIARVFRRQEAQGIVDGDETGIGDMSLLANVQLYSDVTENSVVRFSLLGGLKLPSGNSHRLKEELRETAGVESGIHGHDLALGSGSVDGIIGAQGFWSWQRFFASAAVQYLLRTEGDFQYEYANDLIWSGGPGAFLLLSHDYSLGAQIAITGESKGNDSRAGVSMIDTAITTLYVGPGFSFTWGTSLGADLSADLPVVQNNSSLQIVSDYRLRGGMTWRF
jgi:hypothetical protein